MIKHVVVFFVVFGCFALLFVRKVMRKGGM